MEILLILLVLLSFGAFSKAVRVKMFKRDKATCQRCGRKWDDGWMLHAAHYDHTHGPHYDDIDNGRMLCIDCHRKDHEEGLKNAKTAEERNLHSYALRHLKQTERKRRKSR